MSTFYSLSIKEIRKETNDAVSIVFHIPSELKQTFEFIAGQYITVKKELFGKEIRRSYSICSVPFTEEFRIAVKAVPNGTFSVFATTELKEGDLLEVAPPEGRFILNTNKENAKNYLAIAAGSGITPIISMLKVVLYNEPQSHFDLIFANKTEEDSIFKKEIDALLSTFPEQLSVQYIYSRVTSSDALFGRIDEGNTRYILKNTFSNKTYDKVFLCGPEEMITTTKNTLIEENIKSENILFELFNTSSSEPVEKHEGLSSITILVDDEETTFEMDTTNTILAAALKEGIDAPYSCQGGICSSCLAKVTTGKATMDKNTILSDEEVQEGFILTCQAHPTTEKISIDFDDV